MNHSIFNHHFKGSVVHSKLSKVQASALLNQYNIDLFRLPKILISDPALRALNKTIKTGDIIKIDREVDGEIEPYYRSVILTGQYEVSMEDSEEVSEIK